MAVTVFQQDLDPLAGESAWGCKKRGQHGRWGLCPPSELLMALALLAFSRPLTQDCGPSSPSDPTPHQYILWFKIKEEADHSLIRD